MAVESLISLLIAREHPVAMSPMNAFEIIQTLTPFVEVLERFGIKYYMSGSMASSVHGKGRYAQEVDVVASLQFKHVQTLVILLQQAYSVDADDLAPI